MVGPAATLAALKSLAREWIAFAERYGLAVPEEVIVLDERSVALATPPGTGAEAIFDALSRASSIDGVTYSVFLCGSMTGASRDQAGLDRIALPIVVTSVSSAFGNIETSLMRRLASRERPFAVVLLGFSNEPDTEHSAFLAEIDEFKIGPLIRELGTFPIFDDRGPLLAQLLAWIAKTVDAAARRRLVVAVSDWIQRLEAQVARGIVEEHLNLHRLDRVWDHLQQLLLQFEDAVTREQQELLLAEPDETPPPLAGGVHARITSLGQEFARFYNEVVPPFEVEPPEAQDPAGLADWIRTSSDAYRNAVEERFRYTRAALRWIPAGGEFARLRVEWEAAR